MPVSVDRTRPRLTFLPLNRSPLHHQSLSLEQRLGHRSPGLGNDSREGRPGNPHAPRSLFLIETLLIGQSQRFESIEREFERGEPTRGYPTRLEDQSTQSA
jgi:hypothetical protein